MTTQAIIRRNDPALKIEFTETALALRDKALETSALVCKVNDASSQETAVAAQKELANTRTLVEKARKEAKAPVIEYGRQIDASATKFLEEINAEEMRIAALIADFQQLEQAKARAAELARQAEERKAQEERRQAELAAIRAAEAERAKIEADQRELLRLESEAKSKREKAILEQQRIELGRQKALAEAKSHEELDRINQQHSQAMAAIAEQPKYEPVRAEGQRVVADWDVIVNDVWALARAHPGCVKIEPLIGQVKALLKAGITKIPGVTATEKLKANVSRGRATSAIDV